MTEPALIYIGCATGETSITDITWSTWGKMAAHGVGTLHEDVCGPGCPDMAQGTRVSYPTAGVTLSHPTDTSGALIFQDIFVTSNAPTVQDVGGDDPGSGWGGPGPETST